MSTKPVILTVEDDPEVLRSIARDLRKRYGKDHRIIHTESGRSGMEVLEQLQDRDDSVALLLSDQRMPEMDGVSFLSNATRLFPDSKRVMLTAYADTDAAINAINKSQVDYYLMKPWDPPEERLYPVLDDLLEDWHAGYKPGYGGLRVIGNRWSPRSHEVKDFLARNNIPYQFFDLETNTEACMQAQSAGATEPSKLPLVFLPGGEKLLAPTLPELANYVGLRTTAAEPFYNMAIVGGGPAGLAAAVYGASEGLSTVMLEREAPGGQAGTSSRIENYLGFPAGLSGADLARRAIAQARRFGVEILTPREVTRLDIEGPYKHLQLSDGSRVSCHALMLSTGVSWRRIPAEGADRLAGSGVYYGAALTEAINCKDTEVFVVGAGNSAGQAAIYFATYATKVTMIVRGDSLEAKMSQYLVDRIRNTANINVILNAEVTACHGETHLEEITLADLKSGESNRIAASYLFVFIGAAPRTDWLDNRVVRDRQGFILTGPDLTAEHLKNWPLPRAPFLLEASVPGVFAAGDVRHDSIKRVASAVGEGSVAVHFIHRYLATL